MHVPASAAYMVAHCPAELDVSSAILADYVINVVEANNANAHSPLEGTLSPGFWGFTTNSSAIKVQNKQDLGWVKIL